MRQAAHQHSVAAPSFSNYRFAIGFSNKISIPLHKSLHQRLVDLETMSWDYFCCPQKMHLQNPDLDPSKPAHRTLVRMQRSSVEKNVRRSFVLRWSSQRQTKKMRREKGFGSGFLECTLCYEVNLYIYI